MNFLIKNIISLNVLAALAFCFLERYHEKFSVPMFIYYPASVYNFADNPYPFVGLPGVVNYFCNTLIFVAIVWLLFSGFLKKNYYLISSIASLLLFSVLALPDYEIYSPTLITPTLFVVFNSMVLVVNLRLSKLFNKPAI